MEKNLFYQRVRILTGNSVTPEPTVATIQVPAYIAQLIKNKSGDQNVNIDKTARLVHNVLSRQEEYGNTNLDKYGRFDHDKSFMVQKGLDQSPVIDELVLSVLQQLNLKPKFMWPDGKKAVVCLTHDVDAIDGFSYFWLRKLNWYVQWVKAKIRNRQQEADKWISTLVKWKQYKKNNSDPLISFDQIQALEDSYGFRSTFYFMSLIHGLSREGRRYSTNNPKLAAITQKLSEGGWEIGLHGAYHHHLSVSALKEQKNRLEDLVRKEIRGCRHHYLRVRFPESWKIYARAGFKYSSNMGWGSGYQGFRAGTCFPYYPLGDKTIMEIPFQLMDTNPIVDVKSFMIKFCRYLKSVKAVNGCLVIDFHQEHFQENAVPGVGKVYRNILEFISKDPELSVLTMNEVNQRIRNYLP